MLYKIWQKYKSNEKVKQVAGLFSVNIISIPLSVVTSVIITRFLGPSDYGSFKFILNLFSLATVIFTFGFFQAGNRALVLNNDPQKARELYGAELIITGLLFLIVVISFCGYAFFDKNINEKGLRLVLLLTLPFLGFFWYQKL